MADRIHAAVQRLQPPERNAALDRAGADPELDELRA
jgi:hypothetical protein